MDYVEEILMALEAEQEAEDYRKKIESEKKAKLYKKEAQKSLLEGERKRKEAEKEYKMRKGIGNSKYLSEDYKKELKEAAKKYLKKSGKFDRHYFYWVDLPSNADRFIYRWTVENDDGVKFVYVGQSFNPVKRWYDEVRESVNPYHKNYGFDRSKTLRELFNGDFDAFLKNAKLEILEVCDSKDASERETEWIYATMIMAETLSDYCPIVVLNKEAKYGYID